MIITSIYFKISNPKQLNFEKIKRFKYFAKYLCVKDIIKKIRETLRYYTYLKYFFERCALFIIDLVESCYILSQKQKRS